jgi:putative transposase
MNGIRLHHIQKGKPTQNTYIERFNRSIRREVLDAHLFAILREIRENLHQWMFSYNEERPHVSLGNLPQAIFKQQLTNQNKTTEAA